MRIQHDMEDYEIDDEEKAKGEQVREVVEAGETRII